MTTWPVGAIAAIVEGTSPDTFAFEIFHSETKPRCLALPPHCDQSQLEHKSAATTITTSRHTRTGRPPAMAIPLNPYYPGSMCERPPLGNGPRRTVDKMSATPP